jgi:uncharacterized protein with von Willebrand factor type A (vWA) domain
MMLSNNDELIDDTLLCEDSPYNLEVDHFSIATGEILLHKQKDWKLGAESLTDAFHSLYAHEVALHPAADRKAEAWWREFFASGQADKLRHKTVGKQTLAEAACWDIARKVTEYVNQADDTVGEDGESFASISARIRSVKDACEEAGKEADDAEQIGSSLGAGMGQQITLDEFKELSERMRRSKTLRTILDLAGSMMKFRGAVKKKHIDGFDHVSGVMQSGDLTRLLPSEIMQLAGGPTLSMNMMRRMVENQTLALRKHSIEKAGQGPIVVLIDGSGSMSGGSLYRSGGARPIDEAKALSLCMARIALEQKRWICLVEFGDRGEWKELVLTPEKWDAKALVDWLEHFHSGGTDFGCLLRLANSWSRWGCPKGKVDVIFATDCGAWLGDKIVKPFNEFKKKFDVKMYGLAINSDTGELPLVCDKAVTTSSMGLDSQPIREILSMNT